MKKIYILVLFLFGLFYTVYQSSKAPSTQQEIDVPVLIKIRK